MDKAIGNLIVTLSFDSTEFDSGVSQAQRQLKNFERATRNSGEVARQTGYSLDSSKVYVNNMKETYKALNHTLQEQTKDYEKLGDAHGKDSARRLQLGAQMEQTKAKMIALNKEYDREVMNIAKANSKWYKGSEMVQNFGKGMSDTGQKIQSFGNQWTKASAVITIAGGSLGKVAMDFEKGMIDVQKTTNQSDEEIAALGLTLRELSTEMPIAVSELQALAEAGGRFNIPKDKLAEFAETMAMVGTATDMTAETAAEQFARLSNITGLGVDDFTKFASSLVGLGNNMATTESAVMNMAMGMAGTLSSLGMAEQDILGISAAMSSLGIESERGASSVSKFFVDLETMVQGGAEELADFAKVAGLSVDDFSTKFKESPTDAFQAFIKGLNDIQSEGGSVIETLDSLGINEIRLRDTLLRLAGGSDTLTRALEISGSAWSENIALQEEYDNQLKSRAAQWEIFKNKLTDVAISAGNALLPVFTELMDSSGGLIDGIKGLAEWFVNLDDSTKGFIAKAALAGVALGPIISGVGTLVSFGGGIIQLFGNLSKGLSMFDVLSKKKIFGSLVDGVVDVSTGTIMVSQKLGIFKTALSLLTSPLGLTTIGLAGLYGAYKIFGEEAIKANKALKDFPDITGVTSKQAESLNNVSGSFEELDVAFRTLGTNSVGHASTVVGAVDNIVAEISEINSGKLDDLNDSLKNLPPDVQAAIQQALSDSIGLAESQITRAQEIAAEISAIYEVAKQEQRDLHDFELQRVMGLEAELQGIYSKVLGNSFEQQQQIYSNLTKGLADMTEKQLEERQFTILDYAKREAETLSQAKEGLEKSWQEGLITPEEFYSGIEILEKNYSDNLRKLNISAVQTARERFERINEGFETSFEDLVKFVSDATGLGFNEIVTALQSEAPNFDASIKNMIGVVDDGADGLQEAANKWDKAISDFALSKGLTPSDLGTDHLKEFIEQSKAAGLTWEELHLLSKDASVDDNIKDFLNKTAEAQGGWDAVILAEKNAQINVFGMEELERMVELFGTDFASLSDEQKTALVNASGYAELSDLLYEYGIWKRESPAEPKQAVLETDQAMAAYKELFISQGLWNNSEFLSHIAYIDSNAPDFEEQLASAISEWTGIPIEEVKAMMIETNANEATDSIEGAGTALDSLGGRTATVTINAIDNASGIIAAVGGGLTRLDGTSATTYVNTVSRSRSERYAKGTNFHKGGLAILGDGGKHEPFLTPSGNFGVSPNRDTLFDLPRGTKVWSSLSDFMSKLPRFATGTERSFLDKIKVPQGFMNQSNMMSVGQGETNHYEVNFTISDVTIRDDRDIKLLAKQVKREFDQIANKKRKRVATP